jgi:hypothetical protein
MGISCFSLWLLMLCLSVGQSAYGQSGWVRQKGEVFSQLSLAGFQSDRYFNLEEEEVNTAAFMQRNLFLYAEYGVTEHLTIIANIPLLRSQAFETTETILGTGDLRIDAKYGILQQTLPISFGLGLEAPLARANRFAENEDGLGSINLPTGDGEWNFWATVAVSASLHPLPAYINLSGGFNKRTSYQGMNFQDQWVANSQVGYLLFQKLWLQASLGLAQSLGEADGLVSFVRGDGTAFTQYGFSVAYKLSENWNIGLQYYDNADLIIRRANVYHAPTLGITLSFQKGLISSNNNQ